MDPIASVLPRDVTNHFSQFASFSNDCPESHMINLVPTNNYHIYMHVHKRLSRTLVSTTSLLPLDGINFISA